MSQEAQYAAWGGFGDLSFKGRLSPSQFQDRRTWRVTAQQVVNGYPRHQAQGESERTCSLTMQFSNKFCDITKSVKALDAMAENQVPRAVVIGDDIKGKFTIRSRTLTGMKTTPSGSVVSMTYQCELVEVKDKP
ncbi:phage tail protein [Vibrio parahaemolyticus]|uniref:phage tail protein n=1 Tax=Vibrio parahaemolyticus TaxID=670 RepID=UPI00215B8545|nr:phage tail protein [Vibrio parahaemolyticus]MCR9866629.1 phage tail protein [Vibrio parahaemolyticus]